jgi:hypothetical protein
MIKLTDLLKEIVAKELEEINLISGDADEQTSLDLLVEFMYEGPREFSKVLKQDGINTRPQDFYNDPKMDEKPGPKIIEYIKQNAVDSQDQLYVLVNKYTNKLVHSLFKIDEPLKTMYVGKIATRDSNGPYSMKRMYDIDGKQVSWSHFAKEYKGLGYGSFLYDTVLYRYGVLESDATLYQGSQKMWMFHMPRVAEFFGGTVKNPGGWGGGTGKGKPTLVIPLTVDDVMDGTFVKDSLGSFVAFHDSVPSEIIKIATLTNGLSYREGTLGIMFYDLSINNKIWDDAEKGPRYDYKSDRQFEEQSFIDWLESEKGDTSFEEIISAMTKISDMSYRKLRLDAAEVIFVLAKDATIVISRTGDSYDYTLL